MKRATAHIKFISSNLNGICRLAAAFILATFFLQASAFNEDDYGYEEVSIMLTVARIGSIEIPAIIYNEEVYLPVKDLFDFLRIKNSVKGNLDSIQGFFINQDAPFLIDKVNNRIIHNGKVTQLNSLDIVRTETNLYLKSDYFKHVFDLDFVFNFRSLSVTLTTKLDLPAIRELQQEQMRKNIGHLKGEKKADTTISKMFTLFNISMADWGITATQETMNRSNVKLNLGLGGIIVGGEASALLNFNNNPLQGKQQQFYRWRYVNNHNNLIKQVTAGKVFTQSLSSLNAPITGIQLTNTATTYRKSFGTYTLSHKTEPGWTVELYVNSVLVNYTRADASGFFTFEVPIVYGSSSVKLRFYSPYGEEKVTEQVMNIPFNFMALHQFEYNFTAGLVSDENKSRFSQLNLNYGLSRHITLGAGIEYLSSPAKPQFMPFINTSVRLSTNLLASAEHTVNVRSKATLNYRLPSNLQVDIGYTRFDKDQNVIMTNNLEEKRATLSFPFHTRNYAGFTRFVLNQVIYHGAKDMERRKRTSAELLLSSVYKGISSNLTSSAIFNSSQLSEIISNLSSTFRIDGKTRFTPQVQYEFRKKNFSTVKGELERSLFSRGFLNLTYEKDMINNLFAASIGFRYNFSFGQTSASKRHSTNGSSYMQSARGSIIYDHKTGYINTSNQSNVGRGGLILVAFLDINNNGKRDKNEPKAEGLRMAVTGNRTQKNGNDTTIRISGLEAYNNYIIELDKNSFDNIAWQIKKPTISIIIEPNYFRLIEVPVSIVAEVSGTVYMDNRIELVGIGRIIINIYDENLKLVAKTLSEGDGYFSYVGLSAGTYTARIDEAQLGKLQMSSSPALSFTIHQNKEGDIREGLEFRLNNMEVKK